MIYFTTRIFCLYYLIHVNECLIYKDIQDSYSKDLPKEDIAEFYGSNEFYSDESGKNTELCQLQAYGYYSCLV